MMMNEPFARINISRFTGIAIVTITVLTLHFRGFSQSTIQKVADDHWIIRISHSRVEPISILQVTDLHLGKAGFWRQDQTTFRRIRRLVEIHDPDLLLVTGDLLTGEKPFGSLLALTAAEFFDNLNRPWIYVFGNHDPEGGFGRDQIMEVFATSTWGILGHHRVYGQPGKKYDYLVDIFLDGSALPEWQIFAFDSGSEKGQKSIKKDQLSWFSEMSQQTFSRYNDTIPAVAAFHIPLLQYQIILRDSTILKEGESLEDVYFEEDDGSPYQHFVEAGNIKGHLLWS